MKSLLEEELKNKVAAGCFAAFDTTHTIGKVDFCVAVSAGEMSHAEGAEGKDGVYERSALSAISA